MTKGELVAPAYPVPIGYGDVETALKECLDNINLILDFFTYRSIYLLFISLDIHLPIYLSIYLSIDLSIFYLSL